MEKKNQEITSEEIEFLFGLDSQIYKNISKYFTKHFDKFQNETKQEFVQWKNLFQPLYGDILNKDLFLKHTIYAQILKTILIINLYELEIYQDFIKILETQSFLSVYVPEFRIFNWVSIEESHFKAIMKSIEKNAFKKEDLFHALYQEVINPTTRHVIGEFYTPTILVKKMINDVYSIGDRILDPACGSGSFIIELMKTICKSKISNEKKIKSLVNIYGFDINPLAVITAKFNVFLFFGEFLGKKPSTFPKINIYLMDSLFPNNNNKFNELDVSKCLNSFDVIIGNPPWLTYKDLHSRSYQNKIRQLAEDIDIKPKSQYITHIELGAIFFYAIAQKYLKNKGIIFFVITKSVINGDHCKKFRAFSYFEEIELWDFPDLNFFNIEHVCLKAKYVPKTNKDIKSKYPIKTKILDKKLNVIENTTYSSIKIQDGEVSMLLPSKELEYLTEIRYSQYKSEFNQGATLVPRNLVFFKVIKEQNDHLIISTDPDILSRSKKNWKYEYKRKEVESKYRFNAFLNKDLLPFRLNKTRNVFLPINKEDYNFDIEDLKSDQLAFDFYSSMNEIYKERKKGTSEIKTLFDNLNYWNKLTKQVNVGSFLVVYNASGSNLKSAVIDVSEKKIIVGSENYYFSTELENEAYYLAAILNTPILTKYIKLIKSSRHIHKRPFSFPIPKYDEMNKVHYKLAMKGKILTSLVHDLVYNNPKITAKKIRLILHKKFEKLNELTKQAVFK
ncbi:MAG: N-6 DNA methylase [Candidatus Lokiarchaeota archaeon]|nr:N-6 DNA methylase [Candidatus Lokiarchaeota archaeon]MBD3199160.1 N-6 DNA methylase [Candidatus Lokiarchaeota archaeon]